MKNFKENIISVSLARSNFWAFCVYYDEDFFRKKRRFFKEVALLFQYVVDEYINGRAVSVSVSMPPRAGKSYITSLFAAYWLGRFPELSVMRNTCTATLYQKFSYDTRAIVKSEKYKEIFPEIQLAPDKQNLDGWNLTTSKQVGYFGAGVGGTIIGFGANIAITDDLYKSMQDALSTTTNAFVKLWKESAHDSRKEKNCPEILIGTRWTKNDVIGEAIDKGHLYKSIKIKALDENDKSFCEDVKSTAEYLDIRSKISKSTFDAEYQQEPLSPEGLLLPISSLKFSDISKIPETAYSYRFAVGDPADTGGDKFSVVFMSVAVIGDTFQVYLNSVIHSTHGVEAVSERVRERMTKYSIESMIYESNGVGLAAILQLKNKLNPNQKVVPYPQHENKEVRILSNYEFIRDHFVFDINYKTDPDYASFMLDLCGYSKEGDNKHKKDAIDVLSLASILLKIKYKKILFG